jgi:hypothetical protein
MPCNTLLRTNLIAKTRKETSRNKCYRLLCSKDSIWRTTAEVRESGIPTLDKIANRLDAPAASTNTTILARDIISQLEPLKDTNRNSWRNDSMCGEKVSFKKIEFIAGPANILELIVNYFFIISVFHFIGKKWQILKKQ